MTGHDTVISVPIEIETVFFDTDFDFDSYDQKDASSLARNV